MDRFTCVPSLGTALVLTALIHITGAANAADVRVMSTTALEPAFEKIAPGFEAATGHRLIFSFGASSGTADNALPKRIANGDAADVAIMIGPALDEQIQLGHFLPKTKIDLATSRVGLAVRAGVQLPDINSADALRDALLAARSVAYSSGVSGVYVSATMFPKLGIAESMKPKSVVVEAPALVGHALLRGEADMGLQQMSELLATPGIVIVGRLPDAVQNVNVIAAAVATKARQPEAAQAWLSYLQSPYAVQALRDAGFDPPRS